MKMKKMWPKLLGSMVSSSMLSLLIVPTRTGNAEPTSLTVNESMTNYEDTSASNSLSSVSVEISQLIARDNQSSPTGGSPSANRLIGRASVFITLENHQPTDQAVIIQDIKIIDVSNDNKAIETFSFDTQRFNLRPLENSVIDVHLVNDVGYRGTRYVKALIEYQVSDQVFTVESQSVAVVQH